MKMNNWHYLYQIALLQIIKKFQEDLQNLQPFRSWKKFRNVSTKIQ